MFILLKKCFGDNKIKDDIVHDLENYYKFTKIALDENSELKRSLQRLTEFNNQNISSLIVRKFNPYEDSGGDLSFSVILLDREKNGVMLTSLHGRERTTLYSRPISNGQINAKLLYDEKEALDEALSKFN